MGNMELTAQIRGAGGCEWRSIFCRVCALATTNRLWWLDGRRGNGARLTCVRGRGWVWERYGKAQN